MIETIHSTHSSNFKGKNENPIWQLRVILYNSKKNSIFTHLRASKYARNPQIVIRKRINFYSLYNGRSIRAPACQKFSIVFQQSIVA